MSVLSVINQKGGVAKTTTAVNVAALWARAGLKVLLIDLDSQSSATKSIFGDLPFEKTVYDVLVKNLPAEEAIYNSDLFGIDVMPAETLLSGVDIQLAAQFGRERIFKRALERIKKKYDKVIIDCSPSLGLLTINALMASREIVIPICPEYFSLKGIELILDTLRNIKVGLGHEIKVKGIVITRYRNRKIAHSVIEQVRNQYKIKIFNSYIPDHIVVEEAHHLHLPLAELAPKSPAGKAYEGLSREMNL